MSDTFESSETLDLFERLNDKQCEAVRTTEGFVRVIAGAGSGKTKLLVSRYAYLVRDYGIDSANILCVTFTNKAAGEMKKRIRALIGDGYDTALICTYHGFCARLLRENPEKLFFAKGFQIIDIAQQKAVLAEIYQKYELKLDYASFESILKKISYFKTHSNYVPLFCSPGSCQILPQVESLEEKIIEEFLQRQKAMYALDFDDLISFALYLLETDSEIRDKWQSRLNYIQVDEFQDSSRRELALVDILSGKYNNLMIVGDPDQNIYEWRGSDVKLLVDFDKTHIPTQTVFLNQNYRSTPQILKCANVLIEKNELRVKKDLFTVSPAGAEVTHYHSEDDDAENKAIVGNIRRLIRTGEYTFSDFAVLYRSGFLSRVIEKKFTESNIPYEIYGGVKFYRRMEILDIIAYLKLIEYDDDASLKRIINTPRRQFGRTRLAELETLRERQQPLFDRDAEKTLFHVLKNNLGLPVFRQSGAADFIQFIESMRRAKGKLRISEIVNRVTVESGYEQYIRELGDEERLENLSEFKRIANEFENGFGENLTLAQFLQQIALQSGEDEDKPRDAVKLMTIHAAKGLEFPVVFIVGLTEGIFPSSKTIEERKILGLEEERRLCYVAITRAKEHLFLMDSEGTSEKGIKKLPSRFLHEIGTRNYVRIGKISEDLMREAQGYIRRTTPVSEGENAVAPGSEIEHHIFGRGTIVGIDEKRGSYIIQFDRLSQTRNISRDYFNKPHSLPPAPRAPRPQTEPVIIDAEFTPLKSNERRIEPGKAETIRPLAALPDKIDDVNDDENDYENDFNDNDDEKEDDGEADEISVFAEEAAGNESDNHAPPPDGISEELKRKLRESENLWENPLVPKTGWTCTGITDLREPAAVCEMCGKQIIRYVHHMTHPFYRPLGVGCICAGKMEGNIAAARKREQDFKNKQSRRKNFLSREWKRSRNGNFYLKIREHLIVLYKLEKRKKWKYALDNKFCDELFDTREAAMKAAFEGVEGMICSVQK